MRFKHIVRHKILEVEIDGVTYRATYHRGHRGVYTSYWVISDSETGLEETESPSNRIVNTIPDARTLIDGLASARRQNRSVQPT